jgi:hypothetical protein
MNETSNNIDQINLFELPAAQHNLHLDRPPYRFHRRQRDNLTAVATIEFTEMLCQLDSRYDETLPPCWFKHGYLFALMDALRVQYVSAYGVHTRKVMSKAGISQIPDFPLLSSWQADFWAKENLLLDFIRQYLENHPAGSYEDSHSQPATLSPQALERRQAEALAGLAPVEYYPFDKSLIAYDDPIKIEEDRDNNDTYEGVSSQPTLPLSEPLDADKLSIHIDNPSTPEPLADTSDGVIDWESEEEDEGDDWSEKL